MASKTISAFVNLKSQAAHYIIMGITWRGDMDQLTLWIKLMWCAIYNTKSKMLETKPCFMAPQNNMTFFVILIVYLGIYCMECLLFLTENKLEMNRPTLDINT